MSGYDPDSLVFIVLVVLVLDPVSKYTCQSLLSSDDVSLVRTYGAATFFEVDFFTGPPPS